MLNIYLTNLGKYTEGELVGLWVELPATDDELKNAFKEAQIDGVQYEEYFITDYECEVEGLTDYLGEYENVRELNFLAEQLESLSAYELKKYESALELQSPNDAKDLINLTYNLDNYYLLSNVHNHGDLGYYYIEECGTLEIPEYLTNYFDYEAYGRDMDINAKGTFTSNGYIEETDDSFIEEYSGPEDLPEYDEPENPIKNSMGMKI